jgi:hypothetical protein
MLGVCVAAMLAKNITKMAIITALAEFESICLILFIAF